MQKLILPPQPLDGWPLRAGCVLFDLAANMPAAEVVDETFRQFSGYTHSQHDAFTRAQALWCSRALKSFFCLDCVYSCICVACVHVNVCIEAPV